MDKNESGFAGGVLGFYVGIMLGLALFHFPVPQGAAVEAAAGPNPYARMFGAIPGFEILPAEKRLEAHRAEAQRAVLQRASAGSRESPSREAVATAARVAPRTTLGN